MVSSKGAIAEALKVPFILEKASFLSLFFEFFDARKAFFVDFLRARCKSVESV